MIVLHLRDPVLVHLLHIWSFPCGGHEAVMHSKVACRLLIGFQNFFFFFRGTTDAGKNEPLKYLRSDVQLMKVIVESLKSIKGWPKLNSILFTQPLPKLNRKPHNTTLVWREFKVRRIFLTSLINEWQIFLISNALWKYCPHWKRQAYYFTVCCSIVHWICKMKNRWLQNFFFFLGGQRNFWSAVCTEATPVKSKRALSDLL